MSQQAYRINPDGLVHDSIDGEAIVLSIETGTYYNLSGTAALIWTLLGKGADIGGVCDQLERKFGNVAGLPAQVADFVSDLERDGLIVGIDASQLSSSPEKLDDKSAVWAPPELTAYEDLQDLLTIDPIHDVDDSGWPHARPS